MEKQRTLGQYRTIDLMLLALLMTVCETLMTRAAIGWFPEQPYTVSAVAAVTAIVMMRWGVWGVLHAVLGGAVTCFASGAGAEQYAIYCIGNAFAVLAIGLRQWLTPEGIRGDALKTVVFGLIVILLMQSGRALISLLFGALPGDMLWFFTTDVISSLFTAVVVWVARRQNGVFEDQKNYLLRLQAEREQEKEKYHEG